MGITYVDATATGPTGKQETLELLVDSGAMYSLLPESVWRAIQLEPTRDHVLRLADGSRVVRRMSSCWLRLEEGEDYTPVVLGEPGDQALLGVITLEIFELVLNPFTRTLHPMRVLMPGLLDTQ